MQGGCQGFATAKGALAICLAGFVVFAATAAAGEAQTGADGERSWTNEPLDLSRTYGTPTVLSHSPGATAVVYLVSGDEGSEARAKVALPGRGRLPEQILGEVSNPPVSSDASWAGGAVVDIVIASGRDDGGPFGYACDRDRDHGRIRLGVRAGLVLDA